MRMYSLDVLNMMKDSLRDSAGLGELVWLKVMVRWNRCIPTMVSPSGIGVRQSTREVHVSCGR